MPRTALAWPWAGSAGQCGPRLRSIPKKKSLEKGGWENNTESLFGVQEQQTGGETGRRGERQTDVAMRDYTGLENLG